MKCKSCSNEVPQKFTYAISRNCCPFCGEEIMDAELQTILNDLRDVMATATPNYLDAVYDWLHSNCNLISTDSTEYQALQQEVSNLKTELEQTKEKFVKPVPKSGKLSADPVSIGVDDEGHQVQLSGESIQDPEKTKTFLDRAAASKVAERNQHYKKMVEQIKKSGTVSSTGDKGGSTTITPEMLNAASAEEVEEMERLITGEAPIISSGLDYTDDEDALPPIAEAMIARGAGKATSGGYNPRDVQKLQQLQAKSSRARQALDSGGSVGFIRR